MWGILSCRQLSREQVSPLEDFLSIPVLVVTEFFWFTFTFIPIDIGDQDSLPPYTCLRSTCRIPVFLIVPIHTCMLSHPVLHTLHSKSTQAFFSGHTLVFLDPIHFNRSTFKCVIPRFNMLFHLKNSSSSLELLFSHCPVQKTNP